ncbi:MAG: ATP-binding protein [Candidatus Margulisbacteria bacterium]|jgi:predicted AAA+ superfamily ATPase|nr:ATP-binding protein [Candidatus Margulisiibacteriota bacterium]
MYIRRIIEQDILRAIKRFPVTAVTGPRQCGKSTLVKRVVKKIPKSVYLDLERPSDLRKLENAEWFLSAQKGKLVCIDEVQRQPELFPLIRALVDDWGGTGRFLILGSASRDLLRQSSESLAGRIVYKRLTPFLWTELSKTYSLNRYFAAGAFPRSLLAADRKTSYEWRENFIAAFLERDLRQWAGFAPAAMRRLWQMLAHVNGQTVNYSTLSSSLGLSAVSIKNYIDLLASTYMVEAVPPYVSNLGKRLVKAPKIYVADSGLTAALLGLRSFAELSGHPAFGAVWEQIVLSNIRGWRPDAEIFHYRTTNGAEMDFVVRLGGKVLALECKASYSPSLTKGNYLAIEDIAPQHTFVVIPAAKGWPLKRGIDMVSLEQLFKQLAKI